MPGQQRRVLDWPYVEGLRIDEAMHPLTILAVGMYGRVLPNQNGAPLRLVVPWKYGFKSIQSIVRIRLTEQQPPTSWNLSARPTGARLGCSPSATPHFTCSPTWGSTSPSPGGCSSKTCWSAAT